MNTHIKTLLMIFGAFGLSASLGAMYPDPHHGHQKHGGRHGHGGPHHHHDGHGPHGWHRGGPGMPPPGRPVMHISPTDVQAWLIRNDTDESINISSADGRTTVTLEPDESMTLGRTHEKPVFHVISPYDTKTFSPAHAVVYIKTTPENMLFYAGKEPEREELEESLVSEEYKEKALPGVEETSGE